MTLGLPDRFESKISPEPNSGCWLWTGGVSRGGYAYIRTAHKPMECAHRAVYKLLRGPIPDGLQIDHLCRVRCCVNPDHMECVTGKVNTLRGNSTSAKHVAKTHCSRGHSYSGDNLFVYRGTRQCRACTRIRNDMGSEKRKRERRERK